MKSLSRRKFLQNTAASLAAAGLTHTFSTTSRAAGANSALDRIRLGVVGIGWKGGDHLKVLEEMEGAQVVALCDVDQLHLDEAVERFKARNTSVKTYRDVRHLLDDGEVDAIVVSTPNHWHALITVWACQAGKDVYVEKPVCHDIWEGLRMVEAARKYGRLVQAGTQNRSNRALDEGIGFLHSGELGKVQWMHGVYFKYRASLGKVSGPQIIPPSVDYNLFRGPAAMQPLRRSKLHYDWHWNWDTGNGDLGNIGAHTVDDVRRILGDDRQPGRVMAIGGRFVYQDDGETPNELLACFDYGDFPVFAEVRNLPHKPGVDYMDNLRDSRQSTIVQCEGGYMNFGSGGASVYSNQGKRIRAFSGNGVKEHMANFLEAVRSRKKEDLTCPLEIGVKAGELFHMANLSYRSGFPAALKDIRDVLAVSDAGEAAFESIRGNLVRNGVDLDKDRLTLGSWMSLEDEGRRLKVHNPESELVAQALFKPRNYRAPFVLPQSV